ncbi:LCP family protein [Carnobacterium divergens]|uniref:LCP family protein n=1 Tax=Carnobacterium divergens TaxID=2748 RepID=UPI0010727581|nr:LCP family protein [Carnobacterium divergens]TFI73981.1 cell envelope-related function transcriptional attenuator common domain-containing protein [Carnobacterium divergens]
MSKQTTIQKRRRHFLLGGLILLAIGLTSFAVYGATLLTETKQVIDGSFQPLKRDDGIKKSLSKKEAFSVLLMGIDDTSERNLGSARTDALIYLTINPKNHTVDMVSIPRDTYTTIKTKQTTYQTRINAAYAYGQEEITVPTVEKLLNAPVDYYATFNFNSFLEIVDQLGGIEVDVPITFTDTNTLGNGEVHLKKGKQHLTGEEALALARTRHIDNDVKRGERQQLVLEAIAKKAMDGSIKQYSNVLAVIGKNMKTDLTFNDILDLGKTALGKPYTFTSYVFDWGDVTIDEASMVELFPDSLDFISHRLRVSLKLDDADQRDKKEYQFTSTKESQYN